MKEIYVLHEKDHSNNEESIIGVADSSENALKIMCEYYGKHKEIYLNKVEESGIEWIRKLQVKSYDKSLCEVTVTCQYFTLNEI